MLGEFFSEKMAATRSGHKVPAEALRQQVSRLTPGGRLRLEPAISAREIQLAVKDIPRNRAAGPDLFPAEMYIFCPSMHKAVGALFTSMVENDRIPGKLRRLFIVPLDKPGKDPTQCSNERPTALLSPMIKLLELVLARRIMPHVENKISGSQYAYRRARSTEVLLSDLDRYVTDNIAGKKITYVVGLDVAGAFDSASLIKLVEALLSYQVPAPVCRLVGTWLTGRIFKNKLRSPLGTVYSEDFAPTRGVPQGGVLSPLLWLIFFNSVPRLLRENRF